MLHRKILSEQQRLKRRRENGNARAIRMRKRRANPKDGIIVVVGRKPRKSEIDPIWVYHLKLKHSTIDAIVARLKIAQPGNIFDEAWRRFIETILTRAIENLAKDFL